MQLIYAKFLRCNPCYNGNDLQAETVSFRASIVVILVIMEMTYRCFVDYLLSQDVVILVIMEMTYRNLTLYPSSRAVVILVIMEMTYREPHQLRTVLWL